MLMVIWSSPKPHFHSLLRVYNLQILSEEVGILDEFNGMPFGLSTAPQKLWYSKFTLFLKLYFSQILAQFSWLCC